MRNRRKNPLSGFYQLSPIIQALLIAGVLLVIVLIYLNPSVVSAIIAFLLALEHFAGGNPTDGPPPIQDQTSPVTLDREAGNHSIISNAKHDLLLEVSASSNIRTPPSKRDNPSNRIACNKI